MVVMAAATSTITNASPFIVRTSFTLPQAAVGIAEWAGENNIKKVAALVSDYGPGVDAEKFYSSPFKLTGGQGAGRAAHSAQEPGNSALPAARA
jgi:branched-chain amino acid transport system substrate-binding protein